jgi:hypothetical protein
VTFRLLLDQVRTVDFRVGDRDHAGVGGDRDLGVGGADELSGERLVPVDRVAGANAGPAPRKRRKWWAS